MKNMGLSGKTKRELLKLAGVGSIWTTGSVKTGAIVTKDTKKKSPPKKVVVGIAKKPKAVPPQETSATQKKRTSGKKAAPNKRLPKPTTTIVSKKKESAKLYATIKLPRASSSSTASYTSAGVEENRESAKTAKKQNPISCSSVVATASSVKESGDTTNPRSMARKSGVSILPSVSSSLLNGAMGPAAVKSKASVTKRQQTL